MAGRAAQRPASVAVFSVSTVNDPPTQRALEQGQDAVQDLQVQIRRRSSDLSSLSTTVQNSTWQSALEFGAIGDGRTDDTGALQRAIDATQGRTLYLPRGEYRVTSTLKIVDECHHIVGDFGARAAAGGTELVYYGTGPCIQIGVDNGHDWNIGDYNGPQDQRFENFNIRHGAPDTALVSLDGTTPIYKAGAYGIWDWRGGGITVVGVGLERFEACFVAVESDFDTLDFNDILYSKYGVYVGPRSDQCTIRVRNSFFCDRTVTVDSARQVRIMASSFVGCGTPSTAPVEVRRGSAQVIVQESWFEHLQGYAGTDQLSCVSVGEVDGYGSGGSIQSPGGSPNTASVVGTVVDNPLGYVTSAGNANHTRYIVSVGKCQHLVLDNPAAPPGISLGNFDALVGVQASQSPSSADTQIEIRGVNSTGAYSKLFTNLGGGSPAVQAWATGPSGCKVISTSRVSIISPTAAAGADEFQLSQEGQAGNLFVIAPQYTGGQTTRLRLARSLQPGSAGAAPSSGTWERGDVVFNTDPSAGGFIGWVCTASGTPGTWKSWGVISV